MSYYSSLKKYDIFEEQDKIDLRVVPEFTQVQFENGTTANAVQFIVYPVKLEDNE